MAFRPLPASALACLLAALLAGCAGKGAPEGPDEAVAGVAGGSGAAAGVWNYTTPHPGGVPYVKEYAGRVAPDDFPLSGSAPAGPYVGPVQTCCSINWVEASDLLQTDQLVALRLTLNWTNTPDNHAGLDAAVCVPWNCVSFVENGDESTQMGAHSSTLQLITSGRPEFLDAGNVPVVGARYTNAAVTTGLAYTVRVEAVPVADAVAPSDPYEITIPANGTLTAELVGPHATDGITAGLLLFDDTDRPVHWHPLEGAHGSRHAVPVPAGTYVVFAMDVDGGFVRFSTDRAPEALALRRLAEEFGEVEVATVADAQPHQGTFEYAAPPASLDTFPWFLYDSAPAAQDGFGAPTNDAVRGNRITLSSSSGVIADVDIAQVSAADPQGSGNRVCLQCNGGGEFFPENYVDDDGTYQVAWSSQGGSGRFVLFTARYVR